MIKASLLSLIRGRGCREILMRAGGLGSKIIHEMVNQSLGNIEYKYDNGAVFSISFPLS